MPKLRRYLFPFLSLHTRLNRINFFLQIFTAVASVTYALFNDATRDNIIALFIRVKTWECCNAAP